MPLIQPNEIIVISIAGPSGAGKSELCQMLAEHYQDESVVFSVDNYFKGRARMEDDNFDHPSAIDWILYKQHLQTLKNGDIVENGPIYDMEKHGPSQEKKQVFPKKIILTDGLLNLHTEELRQLADILVYVEAPVLENPNEPNEESICLKRRLARDVSLRGRDEESVRMQWPRVVECYINHVEPSKPYAFFQVANHTNRPQDVKPNIKHIIACIEEIRELRREQIPTVIQQQQFTLY